MTTASASPPAIDTQLLDAAHRVIEHYGWQAATLERIAEEVGVSRMTLHRRKVSRAAVLRALGARLEARHDEAMLTALAAPGSARERLAAALEAECRLAEDNLALGAALDAAGRDAIYHEQRRPALTRDAFVAPYRRLLTDGAADGTLVPTDAQETATVLINLVAHTYRHLRLEHGWDAERARRSVCAIAMQGVVA